MHLVSLMFIPKTIFILIYFYAYIVYYIVIKKHFPSFCLSGTGTNVCYMEELRNIEKYKDNFKKAAGEEMTPEGQEDRITEVRLNVSDCCD